ERSRARARLRRRTPRPAARAASRVGSCRRRYGSRAVHDEPCSQALERDTTDPLHAPQIVDGGERTIACTHLDDPSGQRGSDPRQALELGGAREIDVKGREVVGVITTAARAVAPPGPA